MWSNMGIYDRIVNRQSPIAVVGLGYVGLPLAIAFSKKTDVIGFDLNTKKVEGYLNGIDATGDVGREAIVNSTIDFTSDPEKLEDVQFFIVAVPTPIQSGNVPDLNYVINASSIIGKRLTKGAIVVFESTVYPGVTEEVCVPVLERESGLTCGVDFKVGYSPERINPGDQVHKLENIVKIVSGMDEESLHTISKVYELVIEAGVYKAESIKVAEAAKVIENAQRDINIAFMNELSMLFHQMGIDTKSVLKAAQTKWNFLPFSPGLVGGHCIGIDPYYLTYKAQDTGYQSKIILAGRHINDGMGKYVAQQIIKLLIKLNMDPKKAKIAILGLTYKENCSDIRNTKVTDIISELKEYGLDPLVADPYASPKEVMEEYGIKLSTKSELKNLNMAVVAVPHRQFTELSVSDMENFYNTDQTKVLVDIKSVYDRTELESKGFHYWSL